MKERKLIYSKMFYFNGHYRNRYIEKNETHHAIRLFNRYTFEVTFMPYTWGLGIKVTWRNDLKSISVKCLPFGISLMIEEYVA